jgi:anti-sigma-K factor RskA
LNIENYISSGIIEQYVLGLCNKEEKAELEDLRVQNPSLNEAIISFERSFEEKMMGGVIETSATIDEKILAKLVALDSNLISIPKQNTAKVKTINFSKLLAAASVTLLAVSAFYNYDLFSKNKKQEEQLALNVKNQSATLPLADYNVLQNPRITPVGMYGVGLHTVCRCTMYWDKETGKAYVMIHHLAPTPDGKNYQLWATVNGKQVSVGMVNDKIRGRFVELSGVPQDSNAFMVTLENGGNAAQPTEGAEWLMGKI